MKVRKRRFKKNGESQNFWPSFTDMISTIALILFFLMILAYVQNIVTGSNLEYAKSELAMTKDILEDKIKKLEEANAQIEDAESQLGLLESQLEELNAELTQGEQSLLLLVDKIREQMRIISSSNSELEQLRSKLQGIAVLRLEVLTKVKESIEKELQETRDTDKEFVYIADNGNIVIDEGLVFDLNSTVIKAEGQDLLDELAMAFENVLDESNVRANIDAISIQGHADSTGSAKHNRELSSMRAVSVVDYLLDANPNLESKYGSYFVASGYSEFRPIASNDTTEGRAKNRRIEISIILKDSNIRNVIDKYLDESMDIFNQGNN